MEAIDLSTSQHQRLIDLLKIRGDAGIMVYEIMTPRPNGLGIAQYTARIHELRGKGYKIENVEPGRFVLHQEPVQTSFI